MKIKSFESYINEQYNDVNENWFQMVYDWTKEKFTTWISKLKGKFKDGASYGIDYLKKNPKELEKIQKGLASQNKADIDNLAKSIEAFDLATIANKPELTESEDAESMLDKVSRILGVSLGLLTVFGAVASAIIGLAISNGVLFVIGAIISIIAFSVMGAVSNN